MVIDVDFHRFLGSKSQAWRLACENTRRPG